MRDVHLITRCDQVELLPGAAYAVSRLNMAGFVVVVVTNQTVVARGLASEKQVVAVNKWIQHLVAQHGGEIVRFYFCPHHPNANLPKYRINCCCRKPGPEMVLQARRDLGLVLEGNYFVGDRLSDIIAGHRAGCRTILVQSGMHDSDAIESANYPEESVEPDFVCMDLASATDFILGDVM